MFARNMNTLLRSTVPATRTTSVRAFCSATPVFHSIPTTFTTTTSTTNTTTTIPELAALKVNSAGSNHLYAVFKLHNMPYLVTKGDSVYLPFKLKNAEVGDELVLNEVTTLGSPDFTYNNDKGISPDAFSLKASVVEITKEPYYEVYRKKQRCRRLKTFPVEPYQTVLRINELKLV